MTGSAKSYLRLSAIGSLTTATGAEPNQDCPGSPIAVSRRRCPSASECLTEHWPSRRVRRPTVPPWLSSPLCPKLSPVGVVAGRVPLGVVTLVVLGAVAPVAAPGAGGSPASLMVLQPSDLPARAFVGNGSSSPHVPGATGAYVRKYTQAPDQVGSFTGIQDLDSGADVFPSATVAHSALAAFSKAAVTRTPRYRRVDAATVGNESALFHIEFYSGGFHYEVYTLVWRSGTVEAFIQAEGLDATIDPHQVVALARKQDKRVRVALTSG